MIKKPEYLSVRRAELLAAFRTLNKVKIQSLYQIRRDRESQRAGSPDARETFLVTPAKI
jgi:hypothetical protein